MERLLAQAGHEVRFSSRHPENLDALVAASGPNSSRSSIEEALAFGEVILISIPYGSLPAFGEKYGPQLAGKIVMETGNPYPERDGDIAQRRSLDSGLGTGSLVGTLAACAPGWSGHSILSGTRRWRREAHRPAPQVGVPLASDDPEAMDIVAGLVRDAGFDPVVVGPLSRARDFDVGAPVYNTNKSGPEVRKALRLTQGGTASRLAPEVGDYLALD